MPRVKAFIGCQSLQDNQHLDLTDPIATQHLGMAISAANRKNAGKATRGRGGANRVTKPVGRGGHRFASDTNTAQSPGATQRRNELMEDTDLSEVTGDATPEPLIEKRGCGHVGGPNTTGGAEDSKVAGKRRGRPKKIIEGSGTLETRYPESADVGALEEDVNEQMNPTPTYDTFSNTRVDEDSNVPSLRRRLGELTKRYSDLEARHKDLWSLAVKEAEANYERLRRQAEENASSANRLIAELKAELSNQKSLAKQGKSTQKQLEASESKCDGLESKVSTLNTALSEARLEIKTLNTKLAAARNTETSLKVPGSNLKASHANKANATAQAEAVQAAQAKEDLYCDLTGLIVRGLKQSDNEDVFDCIQTGRNGTLHFKLALDTIDSVDNYEDVQYTYRPQLEEKRDGDLIDILPDYLVEEITFPRLHASKFYTRVIKALTERFE